MGSRSFFGQPLIMVLQVVCLGLSTGVLAAQDPQPRLRFGFDEASGSTTVSETPKGGARTTLQLLDYSGLPIDLHGAEGSGVAGGLNRALNFSPGAGQGTNGPVATATNASLALGEVRAFTASIWFKARSRQPSNIGPRVFLLGAADTAADTGATNTIGLKFQTAAIFHVQLNNVTAEANFVWSLPTNIWIFVSIVYDGETIFVYQGTERKPVELVLAKAAPAQAVRFGASGSLFIGNRRDRARAFDGGLDDFQFYTGAADQRFVEGIRRSATPGPALLAQEDLSPKTNATGAVGQWVLVTAPAFSKALAPLVEYRRSQGFQVTVIETTEVLNSQQTREGNGSALKAHLENVFRPNAGAKYLLLAGPAERGPMAREEYAVPTLEGTRARMKGAPTDYGYGLPDKVGRPTVAVGRFPARNLAEMEGMVAKTLRLEQSPPAGAWRDGLLLMQGNPGGGPMAEMFVDGITRPRLGPLHPAWDFTAISHNSGSLYFLPTGSLQPQTQEYLEAGRLISVYLGHSNPAGLWSNGTNFMSSADWRRINLGRRQGVFFSCGCFACEADRGPDQAYGMAAMRNPNGPVAVIGPYGESYAAPGLLAADGLVRCCSEAPFPARLADYWFSVQHGLAEGEIDPMTFNLLDMSDGTQQKVPLAVQRLEHLEMWTLLGDPALRLPTVPLTLALNAEGRIEAGKSFTIQGRLPPKFRNANVKIDLERTIGSRPPGLEPVPARAPGNAAERDRVMAENLRKVNQRIIATSSTKANERDFSCSLALPSNLGTAIVVVKAYAEQAGEAAQGVLKLPVMAGE